ncbi:hypothetical protein THOM_0856, partial [Trachipleistophora hominis]
VLKMLEKLKSCITDIISRMSSIYGKIKGRLVGRILSVTNSLTGDNN